MRRNHRLRGLVPTLAACAAFSACSLDRMAPRQISEADPTGADVAVSAGAGVAEDVEVLLLNDLAFGASEGASSAARLAPRAATPGPGWSGATGCAYDGGSGRFLCPTLTRDGLTLTRSYAFLDAGGAAQASFDTATTASADFRVAVSGTVTRDDWTAMVQRSRELIASGLAGSEQRRTWNGAGSSMVAGATYASGSGARRYDLQEVDTLTDVVVLLPRRDHPWPVGGSAVRHVTGTMTYDGAAPSAQTVERTVTVTFNGTSIVPLDADGEHFWLNLVTGRVVRRE